MKQMVNQKNRTRASGSYVVFYRVNSDSSAPDYPTTPLSNGDSPVDVPRISVPFNQTVAGLESIVNSAMATTFRQLHEKWLFEIDGISNFNFVMSHPDYLKIIGLGKDAIRFILEDLANDGGPWFTALASITRVENEVVPIQHRGRGSLMRVDWLKWGELNGYFTRRAQFAEKVSSGGGISVHQNK